MKNTTSKKITLYMTYILAASVAGLSLFSCAHVASVASVAAQVAGAAGVIDAGAASAISRSADAIGKAAEEITPEQEYYIGRAVGANILEQYRPFTANPQLTQYLNDICLAIAVNSPRPELYNGYRLLILDSDEFNAFATSGGHIFVTRGLLSCAVSEDALAGVIAHEIAHIQLQHSIKAIKTSRITQALVVTGTSAASVAADTMDLAELTDVFTESVGEIVTTLVNNGYSQSQEFDADKTALGLMAGAGYDPAALMEVLGILRDRQPGNTGGFSKTHPSAEKRIEEAGKSLKDFPSPNTRQYREGRFKAQEL